MILEELEHARQRCADIYAEIVGYGATADAYHVTAPDETQSGVIRAMRRAIQDAGISQRKVIPWFSRARTRLGSKGTPNKFRLRGVEDRRELLSTVGHYDEHGDEKNHDPAYRSQPEQPFLDPQSPFYLR
jgi:hypothetical protein